MRVALFTTVYPATLRFLHDWGESVAAQTVQDFDIWFALDAVRVSDVNDRIGFLPRTNFVHAPQPSNPAHNRNYALARVVNQSDAVVLVDSDDLLLPSRVEAALASVKHSELSATAMQLIDESKNPIAVQFDPQRVGLNIARENVFGLTNTTWRSSLLKECLPVPNGSQLFDWMLATRANLCGASLSFDSKPRMLYRQHGRSIAPLSPPFTSLQVVRATELVLGHQALLETTVLSHYRDGLHIFADAHSAVRRFSTAISREPSLLDKYTAALNSLQPRLTWWSLVAHPSLEYLWRD